MRMWRTVVAALGLLLSSGCDPRASAAAAVGPAAATSPYLHVKTFAVIGAERTPRDAGNYEYGILATYAQAAPWVTWAATDDRSAAAIHAQGIKTTLYVDPHRLSPGGFPMRNAIPTEESAYYHNCDGTRVHTSYNEKTVQYVGDPTSAALRNFFNGYLDEHLKATNGSYDAVWEDDAGPLSEFYQPFQEALPGCWYPGDERYHAAQRDFDAHSRLPVIFENLANFHGSKMSQSVEDVAAPNVIGGLLEFCFAFGNGARAKENGMNWKVQENTAIAVTARDHKMLFCFNYPSSAATPEAIDQRGYILASFLLTYDPERSVLFESVNTPSGVPVEPEAALVTLDPVLPTPPDIEGLHVAGGAYAREYRACYERGKLVGSCAVVVNSSPLVPAAFPYRDGYSRTLVIKGRGVIAGRDDGTLAFGGPPPPVVGPRGWVIAFH